MIFKNGWIVEGQFTIDDELGWKRRIYSAYDSYVGWWKPSVGNCGFGKKIAEFGSTKGVWTNSKEVKKTETYFFGFFKKKPEGDVPLHE